MHPDQQNTCISKFFSYCVLYIETIALVNSGADPPSGVFVSSLSGHV